MTLFRRSLLAVGLSACFAAIAIAQAANGSGSKGEKPKASPGWVVVEEDFWFPLKHDALTAAQKARQHYVRKEERAAASELKKVLSWVQLAEAHATKEGSNQLQILTADLRALIDDLEKGQIPKARIMDNALARVDYALANHHYLKAKDAVGKQDSLRAAEHLIAASLHLKNAAGSAARDNSPDTVEYFDKIVSLGHEKADHIVIKHPQLSDHLNKLKQELDKLASSITRQAE